MSTVVSAVQAFKYPASSSDSPWVLVFFLCVLFPEQVFSSLALPPSSLLTFLLGKLFGLILGKDQLLGKWAFFPQNKLIAFSGKASLAHTDFFSPSKKSQLSLLEFELFFYVP